jgi:hypothetical protein
MNCSGIARFDPGVVALRSAGHDAVTQQRERSIKRGHRGGIDLGAQP